MKITILFLAIMTTALSAGLFYAWTISVIPGLRNIPNRSYLEAMQSINRAILNPGFFIIFFGALIFMIWSAYIQYSVKVNISFWFIIGAIVFYFFGTIGITVIGNVPMNENLELVNLAMLSGQEIESTRLLYENKWNFFNSIRTFFSIFSFSLLLMACLLVDILNNG